jgi:hypothetical protein
MNEKYKFISVTERLPEPDNYLRHIAVTEEGYVYLLTYSKTDAARGTWSDNEHDSGAVIGWVDGSEIYAASKAQFKELHGKWEAEQPHEHNWRIATPDSKWEACTECNEQRRKQ